MKRILMGLILLFLLISNSFADSPNNENEANKHSWALMYDDENVIILFDPSTLIFEKTDNGFNETPTSKAVMLVRIIYTHPEKHIDPVSKKSVQSFIALLVADCDKKQYTIIYGQSIYTDKTVFNFPKPEKLNMKSVSPPQLKSPDTYMTLMFDYVYTIYEQLKKNYNKNIQRQKHLDKDGKMKI